MVKTKRDRVQSGIYFQELVYQHIEIFLAELNEYILTFAQNKESESFFENTYGFKAKKIKLVDFTDTVIARFVDNRDFLNISKADKNSQYYKVRIRDQDILVEYLLNYNYADLPMAAILYYERSQRNLYITENLLKDFEILADCTFNEKIGGKAKLLNEIFKEMFIDGFNKRPIDFINQKYITSVENSSISTYTGSESVDSISFSDLGPQDFQNYLNLHADYKDIIRELRGL